MLITQNNSHDTIPSILRKQDKGKNCWTKSRPICTKKSGSGPKSGNRDQSGGTVAPSYAWRIRDQYRQEMLNVIEAMKCAGDLDFEENGYCLFKS